jgi:hypothetical protein
MQKPSRKNTDAGYTVIELVGSMVVLIMLFTCFYASLNGLNRMQDVIGMESRAVIIMHNLAVRAQAAGSPSAETVSRILADEFRKSPLGNNAKLAVTCLDGKESILAAIVKSNGKPLAELRIRK